MVTEWRDDKLAKQLLRDISKSPIKYVTGEIYQDDNGCQTLHAQIVFEPYDYWHGYWQKTESGKWEPVFGASK